ncbi:MAG: hypothetical protein R3297_02285, partial [Desulfobulbales bacterium]|nr:hypothetical protein [Desulfobulbales bacterium]
FMHRINSNLLPYTEAEFLSLAGRFRETVIMGLRMTAGVSLEGLDKMFGLRPQQYYGETIDRLKSEGLLEEVSSRLRLTGRGALLANRVFEQLV